MAIFRSMLLVLDKEDDAAAVLKWSALKQSPLDLRPVTGRPVHRTLHVHYLRGTSASLICRLAQDKQIDLIVVGAAYQPEATERVLNNTAETVVHQVGCSVFSVKPDNFVSPVAS